MTAVRVVEQRSVVFGRFWTLVRVEDDKTEATGFTSPAEARDHADENGLVVES